MRVDQKVLFVNYALVRSGRRKDMYTLGAGRILIKSIIFVCLLNLMAWKASWAHRTGENEKKNNDKIKKSVQTSSACGQSR